MTRVRVLLCALTFCSLWAWAQAPKVSGQMKDPAPAASSHRVVTPEQLVWKPLIPGVEMAVVFGDPGKAGGLYVIRIRSRKEVKVPPHWHVTDEQVTVLAGSFLLADGDKYDASKLIELKAGAHFLIPATMRHFGLHKAGNVVEVYGEAPFVINFVNPEDDPAKPKAK